LEIAVDANDNKQQYRLAGRPALAVSYTAKLTSEKDISLAKTVNPQFTAFSVNLRISV